MSWFQDVLNVQLASLLEEMLLLAQDVLLVCIKMRQDRENAKPALLEDGQRMKEASLLLIVFPFVVMVPTAQLVSCLV